MEFYKTAGTQLANKSGFLAIDSEVNFRSPQHTYDR